MAVALRLMRFGKKHYPTYRIVAIDKRSKRDGAYIEKVGTYNPMTEPSAITINEERFTYWRRNGAQVSDGLQKLMKKIEATMTSSPMTEEKSAPAKTAKKQTKEATTKTTTKEEKTEEPTKKSTASKKTSAPSTKKAPAKKSEAAAEKPSDTSATSEDQAE